MRQFILKYGMLLSTLALGLGLMAFGLGMLRSAHKSADRLIVAQAQTLARGIRRGPEAFQDFFDDNQDVLRGVAIFQRGVIAKRFGTLSAAEPPPVNRPERVDDFARVVLRPPGRKRRGLPKVLIEFTPTWANQLEKDANENLLVSLLIGFTVIGLGIAVYRLQRHAELAEKKSTHAARLAEIGEMSAVLAHEIRNPLAALKGHAQLLVEKSEGKARSKATLIVDEAGRIQHLVKDLLNYARNPDPVPSDVQPKDVLRRVMAHFEGTQFNVDDAQCPDIIELEDGALESILTNLVDNATHWSEGKPVDIHLSGSQSELACRVRDRGPGIAAGDLEHIFSPFFTRKTKGGAGLGLAIVKRIVDRHRGSIAVESPNDLEGGAIVTLHLSSLS